MIWHACRFTQNRTDIRFVTAGSTPRLDYRRYVAPEPPARGFWEPRTPLGPRCERVPKRVIVAAELPLTPLAKPGKKALRARYGKP